jgi:integrase
LLDGIVQRGSRVMANRVAGLLSQMFRFGVHRDLVEASPVQLLYRPGGKERPKDRILSDTEIKPLLANLDDVLRAPRMACAIPILLLTAQRRGELALARWRDIDFAAKAWTIPAAHSKTGIAHLLPLSPAAAMEFERLKRIADGSSHVMPTDAGNAPSDPNHYARGCAQPEIPCGTWRRRIHAARPAPDLPNGPREARCNRCGCRTRPQSCCARNGRRLQ